jgi:isopropylmalate/homocitrate/citramalate synthase
MNYQQHISNNFIGINDTTLREGEQYNGSVFPIKIQLKILEHLHLIGVDTVEVGNPVVPEIANDIRTLCQIEDRPLIMAHIRNKDTDLDAALKLGVDGVHMLCIVDPKRLDFMGMSLEKHVNNMVENIIKAKAHNIAIRVSVEHGLEKSFFTDALSLLKIANSFNVNRVQVADTRGAILPWDIVDTIVELRKEITVPIGVHLHNDFGHAVSNAIFALASGANWVDTTLLGIGERTGITPLSVFLVNLLDVNSQLCKKYSMALLTEVEQFMAESLHMKMPHNLITSDTAFSHKAGIHINGLLKQGAQIYEPIDPQLIGNHRTIITGSRISGKTQQNEIQIIKFLNDYS